MLHSGSFNGRRIACSCMKTKTILLLGVAIIPLLAGCVSEPVKLSPVGPVPDGHMGDAGNGRLKVFSDTETADIAENNYYPHSSYRILTESGHFVKYVPNHLGEMDESPTLVRLPSGHYQVVAESSSYGRVTVPVIIESGRTTVVRLDRGWHPSSKVPSDKLVYLPDREIVGWSSPITKSSE